MKDKVVVITGATSGIGKALVYEFSEKGSKIVMCARSEEDLKEISKDLVRKNRQVAFIQADVSVESDCKRLIDTAINTFGKIDILINNAGISMRALFETVNLEVIEKVMNVNFWGTVYCTKFALPHILKEKGSVIGISSIAGIVGLPGRSGYSASKFAMHGFLQCVRMENMKKGLHVLVAHPGFTASEIRKKSLNKEGLPQGESPRQEEKMMSAEKVAQHIYKAVVNRRKNLILTFEGNAIAFLSKILPNRLDKIIYRSLAKEPDSPFK